MASESDDDDSEVTSVKNGISTEVQCRDVMSSGDPPRTRCLPSGGQGRKSVSSGGALRPDFQISPPCK